MTISNSGKNVVNHAAVDVGQAEIATAVAVGEAFMVKTYQM